MKSFLFLFLICIFTLTAGAQTQKGNFLIGGSGNGSYSEIVTTKFNIELNPMAGVFVADNLAITAEVNLKYSHNGGIPINSSSKLYSAGIMPGVYFFAPISNRLYFSPHLKAGYLYSLSTRTGGPWTDYRNNYHRLRLEAGPGITYFVTQTAAFKMDIPYVTNFYLSDNGNNYGVLDIKLGFLISFPPKMSGE